MKQLDLGNDSIVKIFFQYAIPSIIGMVVLSLYVIVDGIFVGQYVGHLGLAAVNMAMPFITFVGSITGMIAIGGNVVATIHAGKGDMKKASQIFSFTVSLAAAVSILSTVLGLIFIDPLINLLGANETLAPLVKEYLYVMLFGLIFSQGPMLFDVFIRTDGRPNYSMVVAISSSLLNILLDFVLIGIIGLGLKGAAIATVTSSLLATTLLIGHFLSKKARLKFTLFKPEIEVFRKIIFNGSSEFLTQVSTSVTTLLFNIVIMKALGEMGVSAMSIVLYINTIVIMVIFGLTQSLQPIVSYNLGAGNYKRVHKTLRVAIITAEGISITAFFWMFFKSEPIINIFAKENKELIDMTVYMTKLFITSYFLMGFNIIVSSFFTAIEEAVKSAILSLSRSLLFVVIGIYMLPIFIGEAGIFLSITFAELLTLGISIYYLICYKKNYEKVGKLKNA
ncbi:MATE family efflux transporter [Vallitalea okinawensis]|uniref:MATE family efflux transporter n=1 Tax=Vallitalea okinawensis TaxID=2078660 RepID=UPI000CFBCED4|nr:MATE family efflux transporter [Vallitalea okinawensis]